MVLYEEGKNVYKKDVLDYTQINILLKKSNIGNTLRKLPVGINYIGGVQYGYLINASETINTTVNAAKTYYRKNNASIILGLEYNILWRNIGAFAGIRADVGLNNVYAGDAKTPASLHRTYNSSFSANGGIFYRIPLKRK